MVRHAAVLMTACLLAACQNAETVRPDGLSRPAAVAAAPRSHGEAVQDHVLEADISRRVAQLHPRAFRAVTIGVWQGRVLLMGAVIKPEQRRKAEQVARAAAGTREVLNELVLAEDGALDLFLPDAAREAMLRRQFGLEGEGAPALRVIHGVVFLLGAARSADDAEALKEDVGAADGIKWVVSHLVPSR